MKAKPSPRHARLLDIQAQMTELERDIGRIDAAIDAQQPVQNEEASETVAAIDAEHAAQLAAVALGERPAAELSDIEKRRAEAQARQREQAAQRHRAAAVLSGLETRKAHALDRLSALRSNHVAALIDWVGEQITAAAAGYARACSEVIQARARLAGYALLREHLDPAAARKLGVLRDDFMRLPAANEYLGFLEDWPARNAWGDAIRAEVSGHQIRIDTLDSHQ